MARPGPQLQALDKGVMSTSDQICAPSFNTLVHYYYLAKINVFIIDSF